MAAPKKSRKSPRAQVSLVARYRSPTAFEFVQEECFDLSLGGMFIRSPAPAPAGTLIKLECDVNGKAETIRGVARVVWLREFSSDGQPAGMGVKFVKLETGAREVIAAILEQHGAERDDRDTARPPPAAPNSAQPFKQTPSVRPATSVAQADASAAKVTSTPAAASTTSTAASARVVEAVAAKAGPSPVPNAAPASDSGRPGGARDLRDRLEQAKRTHPEADAPAPQVAKPDAIAGASAAKRAQPSKRDAERGVQPAPDVTTMQPVRPSSKGLVFTLVTLAAAAVLFMVLTRKQAPTGSASAITMQPEAPAAPAPAPAYVLEVATMPDGAHVSAGARALTTPGQLELGQLDEPVQLTAEKDGYEPTTATIDRVGFMLEDGAMRRRIELTLTARVAAEPEPEPVAVAAPAPAPAVQPAKAAPKLVAAKPEAKPARHVHDANPAPAPSAPAEPSAAEVPAAAPAPAPVAAAEPEPKPAQAQPPAVLTIAPADPVPVAQTKPEPKPAAEPKPVAEAKPDAKKGDPKQTPMQAAAICLSTGDNPCVVKALEGKAKSAQEIELLIETYKAMGTTDKAEKWMKVYVDKYPSEHRANSYRRVLDRQKEEAAAAP